MLLRGREREGRASPIALNQQHGCVRIVARQCVARRRLRTLQRCVDSDTKSDDEGRNVVRRLESQVDTDDEEPLLPLSSPAEEVIWAFEADLRSQPRASRRVVLVPSVTGRDARTNSRCARSTVFRDSS